MSLNNVKVPRFYVNLLEFLSITGVGFNNPLFYSIPAQSYTAESFDVSGAVNYMMSWSSSSTSEYYSNIFIAVLGHKLKTNNIAIEPYTDTSQAWWTGGSNVGEGGIPDYDGYSIWRMIGQSSEINFSSQASIKSLIYGNTYDMPVSPNLSLTMSIEYDKAQKTTSYNGSSFSNTFWDSPSMWGADHGAWEIGSSGNQTAFPSRTGRRLWDLKFSFIDDDEMWGPNQLYSNQTPYGSEQEQLDLGYEDGDITNGGAFHRNIMKDNNFFSQVWHKSLGGTIPMILQVDNTDYTPDAFALVEIVGNSLKATRSAFNVYDVALKLREVW